MGLRLHQATPRECESLSFSVDVSIDVSLDGSMAVVAVSLDVSIGVVDVDSSESDVVRARSVSTVRRRTWSWWHLRFRPSDSFTINETGPVLF